MLSAIEAYGLQCDVRREAETRDAENFRQNNAALLALIEKFRAKETPITKSGMAGLAQMTEGWTNAYHWLRLAAESLLQGRKNDAALIATGRAEVVPHEREWLRRAEIYRRYAVFYLRQKPEFVEQKA